MPSLGDGLGDEDPHAPAPAAAGAATPNDSSAATWAAATADARANGATGPDRDELERAHRAEDLLERDRAEMAQPEDLAGQLALAAGQDEAAALELAVERLPVEVVGDERRGDRLRRVARVGEQLEARGRSRPARDAAAHASWRAKTCSAPSAAISRIPSSTW